MYGKLPPPMLHVCSYFFISGICSLGLKQFSGLLQLPLHVSFLSTGSLPLSYHSSLSPETVLFTNLVLSLPYLRYSITPLCLVTEIWTSKDYVLGWPSCYSFAFLSFRTHIHTHTHAECTWSTQKPHPLCPLHMQFLQNLDPSLG